MGRVQTGIVRRRATVRRLRADGMTIRAIAAELHCGQTTVVRDLAALDGEAGSPVVNHAGPNNTRALTHGAHSARMVEPRARELQKAVTAAVPYLNVVEFRAAVAAWARAEAAVEVIAAFVHEHGLLDEAGEPRSATNTLVKLEQHASAQRARLGLDPTSRARLEREMADAAKGRFDLDALVRDGRAALQARVNGSDHD